MLERGKMDRNVIEMVPYCAYKSQAHKMYRIGDKTLPTPEFPVHNECSIALHFVRRFLYGSS